METMAGKVVLIDNFDSDDEHAIQELFSNCQESWHGCHSSSSAMTQGSVKKTPTVDAVCLKLFVLEFCEVGSLK